MTVALLFLPQSLFISLHLKEFTNTYGIFIDITVLGSGSLLFTEILIYFWNVGQKRLTGEEYIKSSGKNKKFRPNREGYFTRIFLAGTKQN